jgi:hypothetical protein
MFYRQEGAIFGYAVDICGPDRRPDYRSYPDVNRLTPVLRANRKLIGLRFADGPELPVC